MVSHVPQRVPGAVRALPNLPLLASGSYISYCPWPRRAPLVVDAPCSPVSPPPIARL